MAGHRSRVVFDAWDTYVANSPQGPVFISFDVEAARQHLTGTLPHCARVIIPVHSPNANGGPVPPENERLWQMEDVLCEMLAADGVACRLVGRLTHHGERELVFQLDDWDSFRPPVGYWMTQYPDYDVDVSEHEGWDFYNDCVRPSAEDWLFMADQKVVESLLRSGSDPAREHALEFVFRGPAAGLRAVRDALTARGYAPLGAPDDAGEAVLVRQMPLDVQAIFDASLEHARLADAHGVTYDGWGAAVVR